MNTSTVHISGALLLDVSDFFGVDKNLQPVDETTRQQQKSAQSLVVTPSTALADQILRSGFEPLSDLRGSSESIQPLQDAGAAAGSSAAGDAPPHQEEPFYDYGGNPEDYGGGGGNDDYSDDGGAGAADDIDNSDGRFSLGKILFGGRVLKRKTPQNQIIDGPKRPTTRGRCSIPTTRALHLPSSPSGKVPNNGGTPCF